MSFFRIFTPNGKEKKRDRSQSRTRNEDRFGIQQWSYYHDLAVQSGHCTISSELSSLRHSRLERSLYNLVYTPNDELNYFILYMESCSLSSYLKFILDIQSYENLIRCHRFRNDDEQQSLALTLFHRYLSIDATYLVPITDEIRRDTLSLICPSNESNVPDVDCFRLSRDFVWQLIENEAFPSYVSSAYHVNYQLKLLTSNQLQLHDLLYHKSSLSYLIEFFEQEKILHYLRFWLAVENFSQSSIHRSIDQQTLTDNAIGIYDQYVSLQAPSRIGFDDAIRARIECSICQPDLDAGPSADTFDQTAWIIYQILQREYFHRFVQSAIFCRYISDLMLKLRHDETSLTSRPVKTEESDGYSINSDNAVPPSSPPAVNSSSSTRQRNPSVSSSCPSVNQELINRPKGKFSMGYIDPLGRFVRDPDVDSIDSSSNRKNSSNPISFLSNLIHNDQEDLAMEEAAARFAENFIQEITNMTANLDND